ncbi:glycosyl hydrolase family 28-related protein [Sphingomonas sp. Mn802worker]|uniref:glycosyl hydrolase family 28-related protein n=1 Tax=Sphingomonas sp. Mn802worker TaxID=629773 RepID=UPI00037E633E|nr:glycosyl hydrolase family 28-related protein [Sphingomonas sp. Mn802worker]
MAKISALELLTAADGTEAVPVVKAGRSRRMSFVALAAAMVPFLTNWYKGDKGDPGGNIMSVGPFSAMSALTIPAGTDIVQTSGAMRGCLIADESLTDADAAAHPLAIVKSANGRFFRREARDLWVEQFGAKGDGVTNDGPAIRACIAYAAFCSRVASQYQRGTPTVNLGVGVFAVGGAIDLHCSVKIQGQTRGMEVGGYATMIVQSGATHTFIVNRYDTQNGAYTGSFAPGADGTEICNIAFRYATGSYERGMGAGSAVLAKARVWLHDCLIEGYPGPGWQVVATSQNAPPPDPVLQGEASGSVIERVVANACYVGGYLAGADSNIQMVANCTFGGNDRWGLLAVQFLSCTFVNNHFKLNGTLLNILCSYQGTRYQCMPERENDASTTVPGTNDAVWSPVDQSVSLSVTWTPGKTWISGGAVYHQNRNARSVFLSNYHEGGAGAPVINFPAFSVGGQWEHAAGSDALFIRGEQGNLTTRALAVVRQNGSMISEINPDRGWVLAGKTTPAGVSFSAYGQDFRFVYANADAAAFFYLTGPYTTRYFGRQSAVIYTPYFHRGLVLGERVVTGTFGAPADGDFADGEIRFNQSPTLGGPTHYHRVGGSGGTWRASGIVGGVQGAARADAPAATAGNAAGATPSAAEFNALVADNAALRAVVNDLLAKLRTARLIAT